MKPLASVVCAALFIVWEALAAAPKEFTSLTHELLKQKPAERGMPAVSEAIRVSMIGELRRAKSDAAISLEFGATRIAVLLMDLGDKDTMIEYVARLRREKDGFAHNGMQTDLSLSRHPELLPILSTNLFLDEPVEARMDVDYQVWPASVAAASIFVSILSRSGEFDGSIKRWLESERAQKPDFHTQRELIRSFWKENAHYFASKNYAAARPPAPTATSPAPTAPSVPAVARPPAKRVQSGTGTNRTATVPATSTAPALAVTPAPGTAPSAAIWPWLLLAISTVGGWLWWRSRH